MSYQRISKYYKGCDGTKLAVDLYLPETEEKVPAIMYTGRSQRRDQFEHMRRILEFLLENGYAVVIPEQRGIGASFGRTEGFHGRVEGKDMKAVMETIAEEEWCTGLFGMLGGSNNGFIQDLTASECPGPLRAVIPCDCHPDFYYQDYPNGASRHINFIHGMMPEPEGIPVDDDTDKVQLKEAGKEHVNNLGFLGQYCANMHRDTINHALGCAPQRENSIWERMDKIAYSNILYYKNGAWFDPGASGSIYAYKVFDGKLLIGPWRHCEIYQCNTPQDQWPKNRPVMDMKNGAFPWEEEYLRFFDYALKGIENGCMSEPPVRYYTCNEEDGKEWKYAADLPLDSQRISTFYFGAKNSETIKSCFDGSLTERPEETEKIITYTIRRDISLYGRMGTLDRRIDGNFAKESVKCLTFTTEPMDGPMEITGIPVLELSAVSDHKDGLFMAVLEEVKPDGSTQFLSEGAIRASHAKQGYHKAYQSLGLPYHPGLESDLAELDAEKPLQLEFVMEALSTVVQDGNRLRLSVFCAEKGYQQPPCVGEDNPVIGLHLSKCKLMLPVIAPDVTEFAGEIVSDGKEQSGSVYVFKRGIYLHVDGTWKCFPCTQVYPVDKKTILFKTEAFDVRKVTEDGMVVVSAEGDISFCLTGKLPGRKVPEMNRPWLHPHRNGQDLPSKYPITFKDQWVATVPVEKCQEGFPDAGPYRTMDLMLNLKLPKEAAGSYPCIVGMHGHGGDYDCFERMTDMLLDAGYAVAAIDYRATPPNRWPSLLYDAKGAIRFLKAHAAEYHLDAERFGILGGSCGGHLSAFIAATNGDPETEGDLGGNTEFTSKIKAAGIYYPWTDAFTFGVDSYNLYPGNMQKVMNSDGEFAPVGYMINFSGSGKGMANLKAHMHEEAYQDAVQRAVQTSPINHITKNSAPSVIVHGIFDCGVVIPMNQSVRFFEKLTMHGVKSLLLCNNNGFYGEDPEVQLAVLEFFKNRV